MLYYSINNNTMEKLFTEYIKLDTNFNGNFRLKIFKKVVESFSVYDFFDLKCWYKSPENKLVVENLLKKHNINLSENIEKTNQRIKNYVQTLEKSQPTLESFEYISFFHEH
jgi:hypothetical protein